jgi:CBS domain-containing protein
MIAVSDLMTRNVFVASEQDKILHIRKLMIERKISRVVIIDERNKPIGIITDKDVLRYIVDDTSGMDLDNLPASKLMSHPVITVQDSLSVQAAAKKMYDARISSLVVVNTNDNLVGIITKTDLCAFFALSMKGKFRVERFMSKPPITVRPSQTIFYAAYLMENKNISHLIVTDGELEGVLSLSDMVNVTPFIYRQRARSKEPVVYSTGLMVPKEYIHLLTIGDFMTRHPITIEGNADLADAAKLMLMHKISGLPVIDNKRKVLGIITKTDILNALAESK